MTIVQEYRQTIASLRRTKPRSHLRLKLQTKASDLLTRILRKEIREGKKSA